MPGPRLAGEIKGKHRGIKWTERKNTRERNREGQNKGNYERKDER